MDPADPYFENTEPLIRLDPTDGNKSIKYELRWRYLT